MSKKARILILFIVVIAIGWGIGKYATPSASQEEGTNISEQNDLQGQPVATPDPSAVVGEASAAPDSTVTTSAAPEETAMPPEASAVPAITVKATATRAPATAKPTNKPTNHSGNDAEQTAAEPDSITVMVNKQYKLPDHYKPTDLVYPNVPFTFTEKIEKRMMRSAAAKALEKMFAGAKSDGIYLAGVSAYRSEATQTTLFNRYVAKDGEAKARTYSAVPGHSEHQTGLSIDVSGSTGKCAAESCFGGTKEAKWLAKHASEYGFIIRYPEGKEAITGYMYEPWHVRYVGKDIATSIAKSNSTLEEYFDAIPVSK